MDLFSLVDKDLGVGSHTDDEYSRNGRTKVVQAVVFMFMAHGWRLRLMTWFAEAVI